MAHAWVTLATNDAYSLGALVLAHSLKRVQTKYNMVILVTGAVTQAMREKLKLSFDLVKEVPLIESKDVDKLALLQRPELGLTFTKINCWRLSQYSKCVFLDADTLVVKNCDELFEYEEFSAARDVGWPDCFNSGVFVYRPSHETFARIQSLALSDGSFDGGDQGLLNMYFSDWSTKDISKHLPFIYNMCSVATYSYAPAFQHFGHQTKIVHFIGPHKPWLQYFDSKQRLVRPKAGQEHTQEYLQYWWDIFCEYVYPILDNDMPATQSQNNTNEINAHTYPFPNPESSVDDCENPWDPWDEYMQKITQNIQPLEPPNTNASIAKSPFIHSQPQSNIAYSAHNTQSFSHLIPITQSTNCDNIHQFSAIHSVIHNNSHCHENTLETYSHQNHPTHFEGDIHSSCNQPVSYDFNQSCHEIPLDILDTHSSNSFNQTHNLISNDHSTTTSSTPKNSIPILPTEHETTTTNDTYLISPIEEVRNNDAGLAGAFAQLKLGEERTAEQEAYESLMRKQSWEVGNIDYLGRDSFDNIWSKISETLSAGNEASASASAVETVAPVSVTATKTTDSIVEQRSSIDIENQNQSQPTVSSQEESKLSSGISDIPEQIQTSTPEKIEPLLSIKDSIQEVKTPKDGALLTSTVESPAPVIQDATESIRAVELEVSSTAASLIIEPKEEQKPIETCPLQQLTESTDPKPIGTSEALSGEHSLQIEQIPPSVVGSGEVILKEEPKSTQTVAETIVPLGPSLADTSQVVTPAKDVNIQESIVKSEKLSQDATDKSEVLNTGLEKKQTEITTTITAATATSEPPKSPNLGTVTTQTPIPLKSPADAIIPAPVDVTPIPLAQKESSDTTHTSCTPVKEFVVPTSSEAKTVVVALEDKTSPTVPIPAPIDISPIPLAEKESSDTIQSTSIPLKELPMPISSKAETTAIGLEEQAPPTDTPKVIDEKPDQSANKGSVATATAISKQKPSSAPTKASTTTKDTKAVGQSSDSSVKDPSATGASVSDTSKQGVPTPTPPPRKTDKSKKPSGKSKK